MWLCKIRVHAGYLIISSSYNLSIFFSYHVFVSFDDIDDIINKVGEFMKTENYTLNFLKGIACLLVVFIHVPFPGQFGEIVKTFGGVAVPIFILISGYYSFNCDESKIKKRLYKMIKIFLYGLILFFLFGLFDSIKDHNIANYINSIFNFTSLYKLVIFCTLDFAIVLWYLVAMIETYIFYYFITKKKLNNKVLKLIPLLFLLYIVLTTFCETYNLDWYLKVNFITRALPWFLTGYLIHKNENIIIEKCNPYIMAFLSISGLSLIYIPLFFNTKINFSCIGYIPFAITIFTAAIINKNFKNNLINFIGKYLSLNIYVYHVLIGGVLSFICKILFNNDYSSNLLFPLICLICTILFSCLINYFKLKINK